MKFSSFKEFYPYYLSEHKNLSTRACHYAGTSAAVVCLVTALMTQVWKLVPIAFVFGYAFAWIGHLFFEKNRPATFKHPLYSLAGDFVMWWEWITQKRDS